MALLAAGVALIPLSLAALLVAYYATGILDFDPETPAVRHARGCCPTPLTVGAAIGFPAAASGVFAVTTAIAILFARAVRFAAVGESRVSDGRATLLRAILVAAVAGLLLGISATAWLHR
jgi:hypothetical protein